MKWFSLIFNSFVGKPVLFLFTFALGLAISSFHFIEDSSRTIQPQQPAQQPPQTFENRNSKTVELRAEEPKNQRTRNVVQSLEVNFPVNGRVIVQAVEEIGKFPQMLFISERTGRVLLRSSIEDENKWLILDKDGLGSQPALRFRLVNSLGFKSSMIMSVGVSHGGSDNAYYLTVFSEVSGKIRRLNQKPIFANIQGGYYLEYLNKKLGYGLAVWNFIWGDGVNESHYSKHKYEIEIYKLQNGKLKRTIRKASRKMYDSDRGFHSLREIGIKAADQRLGIPVIKDTLE